MTNQREDKNAVCSDNVGLVPYKICEKFYVENFTMAARFESDIEDSEVENEQDYNDSDSGSDISVSSVNTEDLSDLSFSEDEDDRAEIGWSRDDSPVNVTAFTSTIGATSTVPEDGTAKDFFCFLCQKNCWRILSRKRTAMRGSVLRENPTRSGTKQTWQKCKRSSDCKSSLEYMCCLKQACIGPMTQLSVYHL